MNELANQLALVFLAGGVVAVLVSFAIGAVNAEFRKQAHKTAVKERQALARLRRMHGM